MHAAARRDHARLTCDERDTIAAVVPSAAFSLAQSSRRTFEPRAVIGGQDDEGVALDAERPKLGEQTTHNGIDLFHDVAIRAGARMPCMWRVGIVGQVRRAQCQIEKEGFRAILVNESLGASPEALLKLWIVDVLAGELD